MNAGTYRFAKNIARKLYLIPGILLLWLFQQCNTPREHQVQTAFYYWKTNYHLNASEKAVLQGTHTSAIYLRLFDVDWNKNEQKALPVGILQSSALPGADTSITFIPVIYITQSCLQKLQDKDLPGLTANISALTGNLCTKYNLRPDEIQIDCDWTKNSTALYFSLLRQLRATAFFKPCLLSCTIRLHQVKFVSASGVPPVDKGLLMVYNMGNLTRYGGHNSILDVKEAKSYLKHLSIYPLPLDVAIPVYHWAALFENSRFKGITYNISRAEFASDAIAKKEDHLYRITQDQEAGGYRFKKGQEIRFEETSKNDLMDIGSFIRAHIKDTAYRLSFFHLDGRGMQPFTVGDLNDIADAFR